MLKRLNYFKNDAIFNYLAFLNVILFFVYFPLDVASISGLSFLKLKNIGYYGAQQHFGHDSVSYTKVFILSCFIAAFLFLLINLLHKYKTLLITFLIAILMFQLCSYHKYFNSERVIVLFLVSAIAAYILHVSEFVNFSVDHLKINSGEFVKINIVNCFLCILLIVIYLSTYTSYVSFHYAEMTIFSKFWKVVESPTIFVPRHGLYEVFLQKFLSFFISSYELIAHASMFFIKFFSYSASLLVIFLIYSKIRDIWFVFFYMILVHSVAFGASWHASLILLGFLGFMIFNQQKKKRKLIAFAIGTCAAIAYFLRIDIGIFIVIASFICIMLYGDLRFVLLFLIGCIFPFIVYIMFWSFDSLVEFIQLTTVMPIKFNDLVWGAGKLNFIDGHLITSKLFVQYFFLIISISLSIKYLKLSQYDIIPFVFLILLSAASFKILLVRIDGSRQFYFTSFLISLPYVMFFVRSKIRSGVYLIVVPALLFLIFSFPAFHSHPMKMPIKSVFSEKYKPVISESNYLKNQTMRAKEVLLTKKYYDIIVKNKDQISFFPFSGYLYVLYNSKPLGKYTDSYQIYPFDNLEIKKQIIASKYIFWYRNNLDGVPDIKRLSYQLNIIAKYFEIIANENNGELIVYKRIKDI